LPLLLFGAAAQDQLGGDLRARAERADADVAARQLLGDHAHRFLAEPHAAVILGDGQAEHAELRHLRDDVEEQVESGSEIQEAFAAAVNRMGEAGDLQREFEKVDETQRKRKSSQPVLTFAGVRNPDPANYMTTSNLAINFESRWATYAKAAGFLVPAVSLWAISNSFLFPKAKQICDDAGLVIPPPLRVVMPLMDLLHEHGFFMFSASMIILIFLEWRSQKWPRYRRPSIGVGVFVVNAVVLVLITAMFTLVLLAAPALFRAKP
jgi:hypothetical protein